MEIIDGNYFSVVEEVVEGYGNQVLEIGAGVFDEGNYISEDYEAWKLVSEIYGRLEIDAGNL